MQGLFIMHGGAEAWHKKFPRRPASKAAVKRLVQAGGAKHVHLEATSAFGNEYEGPIERAPDGRYTFVGPDPYTKRDFYGTIEKTGDSITIS